MFRKWLSWLLVFQHFYIYTLHGTLDKLAKDTIEVSQDAKSGSLYVRVLRKDPGELQKTIWSEKLESNGSVFTSKSPVSKNSNYKIQYTYHNKFLQIGNKDATEGYLFHISPSGDVKLAGLDSSQKVSVLTSGKFSTGEQGLYKGSLLSVTASEIYTIGKLNVDYLKLRIQGFGKRSSSSPIINHGSGELWIGKELHIKQGPGLRIRNLFMNNGRIFNKPGSDSYTLDLHGNDLINEDVRKLNIGNLVYGISSDKDLTIRGVNRLVNKAQIIAGDDKSAPAPKLRINAITIDNYNQIKSSDSLEIEGDQLTNHEKSTVISNATGITVGQLENNSVIKGLRNLRLTLIGQGSYNRGLIYTGMQGQIQVAKYLLNEKDITSYGGLEFQGASGATFTNHGYIKAYGDLSVRDFQTFLQTGSVIKKGKGQLSIQAGEFYQNGTLISEGSLALQGELLKNKGKIKAVGDTLINFEILDNSHLARIKLGSSARLKGQEAFNAGRITVENQFDSTFKSFLNANEILAKDMTFTLSHTLENTGRIIGRSHISLWVSNQAVNKGRMKSKGAFFWKGSLFQNDGELFSKSADMDGEKLVNSGVWEVAETLILQLAEFINSGDLTAFRFDAKEIGSILNQKALKVLETFWGKVTSLTNNGLFNVESISNLQGADFLNSGDFKIKKGADLIFSKAFTNHAQIQYGKHKGNFSLKTHRFDQSQRASLAGAGELCLATGIFKNAGLLRTDKDLSLTIKPTSLKDEASQNSGTVSVGQRTFITLDGQLTHQQNGEMKSIGPLEMIGKGKFINEGAFNPESRLTMTLREFENKSKFHLKEQGEFALQRFHNAREIEGDEDLVFENLGSWTNTEVGTILGHKKISLLGRGGVANKGSITSHQTFNIDAKSLTNAGKIQSHSRLKIQAQEESSNSGTIMSRDNLQIGMKTLTNKGHIKSVKTMTLEGEDFTNQGPDSTLHAAEKLEMTLSRQLHNEGVMDGKTQTDIKASAFTNEGITSSAGGDLSMETSNFLNSNIISSEKSLNLKTQRGEQKGLMLSRGDITWKVDNHFKVKRNPRKDSNDKDLSDVESKGKFTILGKGYLENEGILKSGDHLETNLSLENRYTMSAKSISLNGHNRGVKVINTAQGSMMSYSFLESFELDDLINQGKIISENDFQLQTLNLENTGLIGSKTGRGSLETQTLSNSGTVESKDHLKLNVKEKLNSSGTLASHDDVTLEGNSSAAFENKGKILSSGVFTATDFQKFINEETAEIQGNKGFLISAEDAQNKGYIHSEEGQGTITSQMLSNSGTLESKDNLTINTQQSLINTGELAASKQVKIEGTGTASLDGTLRGDEGVVIEKNQHAHTATLEVETKENSTLVSLKEVTFRNLEKLAHAGKVLAGELLELLGIQTLKTQDKSVFQSQKDITLKAIDKLDAKGQILAKSALVTEHVKEGHLLDTGVLHGTESLILKNIELLKVAGKAMGGTLLFDALASLNILAQGLIHSTQKAIFKEIEAFKNKGKILSEDVLSVYTTHVLENEGAMASIKKTSFSGRGTIKNSGTLPGEGDLQITEFVGSLLNTDQGVIESLAKIFIGNLEQFENHGKVVSQNDLRIESQSMISTGEITSSQGQSEIETKALNNSGKIQSKENLALKTYQSLINTGTLASSKTVKIEGTGKALLDGILHGDEGVVIEKSPNAHTGTLEVETKETSTLESLKAVTFQNLHKLILSGKVVASELLQFLGIQTLETQHKSVLQSQKDINLKAIDKLDVKGQILAGKVQRSENSETGIFSSIGTFTIGNVRLLNVAGKIMGGTLLLDTLAALNILTQGLIHSTQKAIFKEIEDLKNKGKILSEDELAVHTTRALENEGVMASVKTTSLSGRGTIKNSGTLPAEGGLQITEFVGSLLNTAQGTIESLEKILIGNLEQFENHGKVVSQNELMIGSQSLINTGEITSSEGPGEIETKVLESSGKIYAKENLVLRTHHSLKTTGTLASSKQVKIEGTGTAALDGTLHGDEGVVIEKNPNAHTGTLKVETKETSTLESLKAVTFQNLHKLTLSGKVVASELLQFLGIQTLETQERSQLKSGKSVSLGNINEFNHNGVLIAGTELNLEAIRTLAALAQSLIQSTQDILIKGLHKLDVKGHILGGKLTIEEVKDVGLSENGVFQGTNSLAIKRVELLDIAGKLIGGILLLDTVETLNLFAQGLLQSTKTTTFNELQTLNNKGQIFSDEALSLNLTKLLSNENLLSSKKTISLSGRGDFKNKGKVLADGAIALANFEGRLINAQSGVVSSQTQVLFANLKHFQNSGKVIGKTGALFSADRFENESRAVIQAGDAATLATLGITLKSGRNAGQIQSSGNLTAAFQENFDNIATLNSEGLLKLKGQSSTAILKNQNANARLYGKTGVSFEVENANTLTVKNTNQAQIESPKDIDFKRGTTLENGGEVKSKAKLTLNQDAMVNNGLLSALNLIFVALKSLTNSTGASISIQALDTAKDWAKLTTLTNKGTLQVKSGLNIFDLSTFSNEGNIGAEGLLHITFNQAWTNLGNLLGLQGTVIEAPQFVNKGRVGSKGAPLHIKAGVIDNQKTLESDSEILLEAKPQFFKAPKGVKTPNASLTNAGDIQSQSHVILKADDIKLQKSKGVKGVNVIVEAAQASQTLLGGVDVQKVLKLVSAKAITVAGGSLNYGLEIVGPVYLTGLLKCISLTLTQPGAFNNDYGIQTSGFVSLNVGAFYNNKDLTALGGLTVKASALDNKAVLYGHTGSQIAVTGNIANTKTIASGADLTITAQNFDNKKGGVVDAWRDLSLIVANALDNTVASIWSGGEMRLQGKTLRNQRDGYHMIQPVWTDFVHKKAEVPNSPKGASIQAQQNLTLTFDSIKSEASDIVSSQGDILFNFKTLNNLSKLLSNWQETKIWTVVGKYKKRWKSRCLFGYAWQQDTVAPSCLPSLISAGGDVIFKINGQTHLLPQSVPQAWESYRQQVLHSKKNKQKFDIWVQTSNHWGDGITWDSSRITVDPAYATLSPDLKPFEKPNSFLSNDNEKRLIIVKYLSKPIMKWSSRNIANRYLVPSGIPQRTLRTETITVTNPRKVILAQLFPGFTNTGTIRARTITGNVGHFQHGLKGLEFQNTTVIPPLAILVFDMANVGEGYLMRYDVTRQQPQAINSIVPMDANALVKPQDFMIPQVNNVLKALSQSGLSNIEVSMLSQTGNQSLNNTQLQKIDPSSITAETVIISLRNRVKKQSHVFFNGNLPEIGSLNYNLPPVAIAVIHDPQMTGQERLLMHPILEARELQNTLVTALRTPNIYVNLPNMILQHWVLRESGVKQARAVKGLSPLEVTETAIGPRRPHRELLDASLLPKFNNPAIVYRLKDYEGEAVLVAEMILGSRKVAEAFVHDNQALLLANYVNLYAHSLDMTGDVVGGAVDLKSETSTHLEGARIGATVGDVNLEGQGPTTVTTNKIVKHNGDHQNYTHRETHTPTLIDAQRQAKITSKAAVHLTSAQIKGQKGSHIKGKTVTQTDAKNVSIQHSESSKRGTFKKKTTVSHSESHDVVRTTLEGGDGRAVVESTHGSVLEAPKLKGKAPALIIGPAEVRVSQSSSYKNTQTSKRGMVTQSQATQGAQNTKVHMMESESKVEFTHPEFVSVQVKSKGQSLKATLDALQKEPQYSWIQDLRKNPHVNWDQVEEIHNSWNQKSSGLTAGASLVISLAVAIAVAGPASGLATSLLGVPGATAMSVTAHGMATTAFKTIASQAALSLVNAKGNVGTALKKLVSTQNIKHLAATVAATGLIGTSPQLPGNANLLDYVAVAATQTIIQKSTQVAIEGKSLKTALKKAPLEVVVNSLGSYSASEIGSNREELGYALHKAAHGLVGAASGLVLSEGKWKGAVSGAMGAMGAEVLVEAMSNNDIQSALEESLTQAKKEGRTLDKKEFEKALQDKLRFNADLSKLAVAAIAWGTDLDGEIAVHVADTAIKNNAVAHAIIGGLVLWTAYDIYSTYENEGPEAALQELAVQGAIQVVSLCVGKVAYKVGGKVYPHAKLAWEAVVAENPVLYKAAETCANVAHKLKDRIASAPAVQLLEKLKGKTVWDKGPVVRGEIIEKKLGQNLHQNFPTIDKFVDGIVTSIKSLDLRAKTYQNPATLRRTIKGYIDKVAKFEEGRLLDRVILKEEINARSLELAIPNKGSSMQGQILKEMQDYAQSQSVDLKIIIIK